MPTLPRLMGAAKSHSRAVDYEKKQAKRTSSG
jgi:hypothetical protein